VGRLRPGWVIIAGQHSSHSLFLVAVPGRLFTPGISEFRSNFGPIQERDCATFSAVSDTRCSTYLIFAAFLTAGGTKLLNALFAVPYAGCQPIFDPSVGLPWATGTADPCSPWSTYPLISEL
jgi:hypothetical protein